MGTAKACLAPACFIGSHCSQCSHRSVRRRCVYRVRCIDRAGIEKHPNPTANISARIKRMHAPSSQTRARSGPRSPISLIFERPGLELPYTVCTPRKDPLPALDGPGLHSPARVGPPAPARERALPSDPRQGRHVSEQLLSGTAQLTQKMSALSVGLLDDGEAASPPFDLRPDLGHAFLARRR